MTKPCDYLISYIFDNQPQSATLQAEDAVLTPEQVLTYLQSLHDNASAGSISDIQVSRIYRDKLVATPHHHLQP